jgi:hypothetical protein
VEGAERRAEDQSWTGYTLPAHNLDPIWKTKIQRQAAAIEKNSPQWVQCFFSWKEVCRGLHGDLNCYLVDELSLESSFLL